MPSGGFGSAVAGGLSVVGGIVNDRAIKGATNALTGHADQAIDKIGSARDEAVGLFKPYSELGDNAASRLNNQLTNPTTRANIVDNDLFQSLFGNAKRAILSNAATGKGLNSGQTLQDLTNASLGIGSQIYQQDVNNLFNASNMGFNAAANKGNTIMGSTGSIVDLLTQKANAVAAGKIGRANNINSVGNNLMGIGQYALGG